MKHIRSIIITVIFAAATSVTMYAQDTIQAEKIEDNVLEIDTINKNAAIDYETFKNLRDKQMLEFLKDNDTESYNIFQLGEMKREVGRDLLISGLAFTGAGVAVLACWGIVVPFTAFIGFWAALMGNPSVLDFLDSWIGYFPVFATIGLSAIAIGQPILIASIVLKKQGKALKQQAKNNYENKFYSGYTSSLNFNFYPNGFGVTFKF